VLSPLWFQVRAPGEYRTVRSNSATIPTTHRDPDRNAATDPAQNETRLRFIPSGLANEVFLDTFERVASFEHGVKFPKRLFDAYANEVARVDQNHDGVISFQEANVDGTSDGLPNTTVLAGDSVRPLRGDT
jgi:hypothetical protein